MASGLIAQLASSLLSWNDGAAASAVLVRDPLGDGYVRRLKASEGVDNSGGTKIGVAPTQTISFTATANVSTYPCDATAGAIVATLPTAVGNSGLRITFKKIDAVANVKISGTGAETIDGVAPATGKTITTQWGSITVYSNGANWLLESTMGTIT